MSSEYTPPPIDITDLQPFDPPMTRWRAALGARKESNVDVLVVGDSLAELGDAGIEYRFMEHFARQSAADLGMGYGIYYPAVQGTVISKQTGDPWTMVGGASGASFAVNWGLGSRMWFGTANNNTATLNFTGDRVVLLYTQYVAGSTSAQVVLDGVQVTALDMSEAVTVNGAQWDSGALTYGAHTLLIRYPSGVANGAMAIEGAMVEVGPRPCFRVWDSSQSGYSAASFAGQAVANSFHTSLPNIDPALTIFCLGVNDATQAQTPAQVITNINTLITRIQGQIDPDCSIAFMVEWEIGTEAAGFYDGFAALQRSVARASNWLTIDLNKAAGRLQTDTYGVTTDQVHASKKGHRLIADLMSRTIFGDVKATLDVITSTSGKTVFNDSAIDHTNKRLGVGTRSPSYKMDLRTPGVLASQLHIASADTDTGAYITSVSADNFFIQGGVALNSSLQWVAKSTSAGIMGTALGIYNFYANSGLTPGNTFTPTEVFRLVDASGSLPTAIPAALANASTNYFLTGTTGTGAPTFTTRSNGTRYVLWPATTGSTVDYGLGIDGGYVWNSVAAVNAVIGWKWFAGTTEVMRLQSDGHLSIRAGGSTGILAKPGGVIFDHFADVGNVDTGEDDLYSDTIPASTLSVNGDKLVAQYSGIFVSSATATRRLKAYFGGTLIYDSTALSLSVSADWDMSIIVIRESATVVRCSVKVNTTTASSAPYTAYTRITGLTLTNTNILKITGEAAGVGAATNDIVAKLSTVEWKSAA